MVVEVSVLAQLHVRPCRHRCLSLMRELSKGRGYLRVC